MEVISHEADDVLAEDREGRPFTGEKRHTVMAFVEKRPLLTQLVDGDRIHEPIEQLLGQGFIWWGGEGNAWVGDTEWHPDMVEIGYRLVKVLFYLDPVATDTGCLRVIPGSHRSPLHDELEPLRYWRVKQNVDAGSTPPKALEEFLAKGLDPDSPPFGVERRALPGFAVETEPGDVVFFNQNLFHGSWGGRAAAACFH